MDNTDSKSYFARVANRWDVMRQSFFSEDLREKIYSAADIREGRTVADIGAGTGFITEGLLDKNVKIVAVDRSPEMLEQMENKFKGIEGISYRQGEAEGLPLDDGSVDYAFANMYIHHVEEPPAAIKEMARILKPGGRLIITDLDEHSYEFLRVEHHDRWRGFKRDDIKRWFSEAGLKNINIDCAGEECRSESCCSQQNASINIFLAYGEK